MVFKEVEPASEESGVDLIRDFDPSFRLVD